MRTHYAGHDEQYRKHKANGQVGWETVAVIEENLASLALALQSSHMPQSGRVLEVGCGAGDLSLWLAARGYSVHGVDIAPTAIKWAREKASERGLQAEFQIGDVTNLAGYSDNMFDLVVDGYCLHCIIGQDRRAFLDSVHRVLKPGGIFHVRTMCDDPVTDACRRNYDPISRCQIYGDIAARYYGLADDIQAEVGAAAFQIIVSAVERPQDQVGQDLLSLDARKPNSLNISLQNNLIR